MKDSFQQPIRTEYLFEMEELCDRFESSLRRNQPIPISSIVENASPEIHSLLLTELQSVADQYLVETVSDSAKSKNECEEKFGQFQLNEVVGQGGSGVVWRAYDEELGRWVALKISHPLSASDSQRFVREAQATAKLNHPNIIPVYQAGERDGRCFLVSEFCEGESLSSWIRQNPVSWSKAVTLVIEVLKAIEHSHDMGIIHRDIKPHNIMICSDGSVKVTDFGLAKNLIHDQSLTKDGDLIGTPSYMAPEQAKGGAAKCDFRSDIYSIGVVLYQLLSGKLPFSGCFERVVFQAIHTQAPSLRSIDPEIPKELEVICAKCLEKSPERRFQKAADLRKELERYLLGQPVRTKKVSLHGRYLRWLQHDPKIAIPTTTCVILLAIVAVISSTASYLLATAWKKESAMVSVVKKSLAEAIEAEKQALEEKEKAESAQKQVTEAAKRSNILSENRRKEADFLASLLAPSDLVGMNQAQPGRDGRVRWLSENEIHQAIKLANQLLEESPTSRARIQGILANALRSRGHLDKAEQLLKEAANSLQKTDLSSDPLSSSDRAMNHLHWAYLFHHREQFEDCDTHYQKAIKLFKEESENHPNSKVCSLQLAQAEVGLGASLLKQKKPFAARPYVFAALEKRRKFLPKGDSLLLATELAYLQCFPDGNLKELPALFKESKKDQFQMAMKIYWSILANRKLRLYSKAIKDYQELIELLQKNLGKDHWLVIYSLGDYAGLLRQAGNYREAKEIVQDVIDRSRPIARWHPKRMQAMMKLAHELRLSHDFHNALQNLLEVKNHPLPKWNDNVGLHSELAWCYLKIGESDKAKEHSKKALKENGRNTAHETAWHCFTHANALKACQQLNLSQKIHQQARDIAVQLVEKSELPNHSTWLKRIGLILSHHGEREKAELVFRKAIEVCKKEYSEGHPRVADLKFLLAKNLISRKRYLEAKELLNQVQSVYKKSLPADDRRISRTIDQLRQLK